MELHNYLHMLRRNWVIITAATLVGLLVGGLASALTKPTYTADTQLFVAIQGSGSIQELQQGNTFSQARVQSYVKIVESPAVLQPVIDTLGLSITANELAGRIKASSDASTVLINIAVDDGSPVQAAGLAQAVANSLIQAVDSLEKPKTGGSSPVRLSLTKPAVAPSSPAAPNTHLNLILGLLVGLSLGVAAAILRSTLDSRVRGEIELRRVTDAPLLGVVAFSQDATKKPLLTQAPAQSPRAESFRQLRTNLQFANVSGRATSVVVTSSLPGEGKSTTATNLAIALAQAGQTVCLVDADLRRPMINDYLGLDRNAGLTTALVGLADVNDLLQQWGEDTLYVLTSGELPPNPSELLGSDAMKQLVERLDQAFDMVIIDAPPLLPVTDAAVLSRHVGGVIVVVGALKTKLHDLEKSFKALQMVDANLLGIVLNRVPAKGPDAYAYAYYGQTDNAVDTAGRGQGKKNSTASEAASADAWPVGDFRATILEDQERPPTSFPGSKSVTGNSSWR